MIAAVITNEIMIKSSDGEDIPISSPRLAHPLTTPFSAKEKVISGWHFPRELSEENKAKLETIMFRKN